MGVRGPAAQATTAAMSPVLPESLLRLMSAAERAKLGKAGRTMPEIEAGIIAKNEAELQLQLKNLLALRDIVPCSPRFGKKTGIIAGWPDLTFAYRGIPCLWEAKHERNGLSDDQEKLRPALMANGWRYAVIRSVDEGRAFLNLIDQQP